MKNSFAKKTVAIAASLLLSQSVFATDLTGDQVYISGNTDSSGNADEGVFITSNSRYDPRGTAPAYSNDQAYIKLLSDGAAVIGSKGGSGNVITSLIEVANNRVFIDGGGAVITVDETVSINTDTSIGGTLGVTGGTTTAGITNTGGLTQTGASTLVGTTSINATGGGATNIGSAASTNTILGATNVTGTTTINAAGGANTTIGTLNGASVNTLQGAANSITATGNNTFTSTTGTNAISAQTGNSITTATGNNVMTATTGSNNLTALTENNISAATNNMTATTANNIQGPLNNIGTSSVSSNFIGNASANTTVTATAGNARQALANGSANSTVTAGTSGLTARAGTANVTTTGQVLLSNTAGTTVDANGKILVTGATGYANPAAPTAAVTLTNGYGNTHGVVVTEYQTTLSGGTQSSSMTLNDRAATFSNAQTGAPITVTGVADGRADFDAVNVRQFAGAIASVAAQANIPALSAGQDRTFGMGVGNFMGKSALAMGMNIRGSANSVYKATVSSGLNNGAKQAVVAVGGAWGF